MKLDARRREWLLKVALVELGLWIAKSDGSVSRQEATRILQLLHDWGTTPIELQQLKRLGARRVVDPEPPRSILHRLPDLLSGEQRLVLLEVLADAAFRDQERCSAKVGRLLDICRAMKMDQLRGLQLINRVAENVRLRPDRPRSEEPTMILPQQLGLKRALAALGIDRADPAQARSAYRRLTLLYHPDRHPGVDEQRKDQLLHRLVEVRQAYQQVMQYDRAQQPFAG